MNIAFKNWKNALDNDSGFKKHELSSGHKSCLLKWINYKDSKTGTEKSVMSQMSEAHNKLVKENRQYISIIADTLLFTALQNIAQRGDDESLVSNSET